MYKKIIIIICLFFLVGCTDSNINTKTLQEIIDSSIEKDGSFDNTNNKGYKYYLPSEFNIYNDKDYIQELLSHNTIYYLNIDIVSYYYDNDMSTVHDLDDYEYY